MGEDSGEKTEEPTPHKLREAREKGNISKSKDLTNAILLLVSFYMLKIFGVQIWEHLTRLCIELVHFYNEPFTGSLAMYILKHVILTFASCLGPLLGINFVVIILIEFSQVGMIFSAESISPKLSKLNPIEGFKKYFSLKQYVELLKSSLKMFFVILIIYTTLKANFYMVIISQQLTLWQVMAFTGDLVMKVVVRVGLFYIAVGIFDFFYQRYEYIKGLKMSKKEIKDEYKRLEGDPTIKQRQRDAQRQMSQGRQMGAVPGADVVVTNPVHFALAIKYSPNFMEAPIVVAKGKRLLAKEIKRIADLNFVPIVENPPLARQIFQQTEIGEVIPDDCFQVVAEILAFVYNLKKKRQLST
ncbi:MAG: flagellar biosynthesis protein FlhB [bacterium]